MLVHSTTDLLANDDLKFAGVKDTTHCNTLCRQTENQCLSYGYNADLQICKTYYRYVEQSGFVADPSSSRVFYQFNCFNCFDTCPAPEDANLLINSGFESPIDSNSTLSPWNAYGASSLGDGSDSPGYLSHTAAHQTESISLVQRFFICPAAFYDITFDFKFRYFEKSDGGNPPRIDVLVLDLRTLLLLPTTPKNNNTWFPFRSTF